MTYSALIEVRFSQSRAAVYAALCDTQRYILWNAGLKLVTAEESLRPGLQYETESVVAGHIIRAQIQVGRMIPDEVIEVANAAGAIRYEAMYLLRDAGDGGTVVQMVIHFRFRNFVLDLARPAIEAMAHSRLQADLEMLRLVMGDGSVVDVARD
jgi:uncharacterized protein YndB with AHSA1/START domain